MCGIIGGYGSFGHFPFGAARRVILVLWAALIRGPDLASALREAWSRWLCLCVCDWSRVRDVLKTSAGVHKTTCPAVLIVDGKRLFYQWTKPYLYKEQRKALSKIPGYLVPYFGGQQVVQVGRVSLNQSRHCDTFPVGPYYAP